jgi:hypothetical protein
MMTEKNLLNIVVKNKTAKEFDNILFLMLKDQNCEYLFWLLSSCLIIQGVPGGKDLTSGECFLGQTIPM